MKVESLEQAVGEIQFRRLVSQSTLAEKIDGRIVSFPLSSRMQDHGVHPVAEAVCRVAVGPVVAL